MCRHGSTSRCMSGSLLLSRQGGCMAALTVILLSAAAALLPSPPCSDAARVYMRHHKSTRLAPQSPPLQVAFASSLPACSRSAAAAAAGAGGASNFLWVLTAVAGGAEKVTDDLREAGLIPKSVSRCVLFGGSSSVGCFGCRGWCCMCMAAPCAVPVLQCGAWCTMVCQYVSMYPAAVLALTDNLSAAAAAHPRAACCVPHV
jgi:hypothetical protein